VLSTARVGFSQCSKHRHYRIALEFGAMRARIAYERLNELQRRRLLRRTSAHNPVPILVGEHREVLHRLHISPTGQRLPRAWDVDVPPGALSAALEALTIACQLSACFRLQPPRSMQRPRSQPALSTGCAHISSALRRLIFREGCPAPRGELKFAASQQNAAARQRLLLIKRAAAVLVPKQVFSWN